MADTAAASVITDEELPQDSHGGKLSQGEERPRKKPEEPRESQQGQPAKDGGQHKSEGSSKSEGQNSSKAPSKDEGQVRMDKKGPLKSALEAGVATKMTGRSENNRSTVSSKLQAEQSRQTARDQHPDQPRHQSQDKVVANRQQQDRQSPSLERGAPSAAQSRFVLFPEGYHEHYLRAAKRQEKLRGMLDRMLGTNRKKDEGAGNGAATPPTHSGAHSPAEQVSGQAATKPQDPANLSLISSWIDDLKSDRAAAPKKESTTNSNPTATLVEKYGKCHEIIGRGAFGVVRISHKSDASGELLYAVKEFRRRPQESAKKYTKRLTSEFCISSSLHHNNIIHTLDLLQDAKGDYCEVMEYCAGGDLYTLILAAGKLEVAEADCFFKQLMRGVSYIHEMGVAHRDLKPENLLLMPDGGLKVTDFGNGECFRMAWEKEAHLTAGLCGSAPYIAPEEYTDKEFDPRAVDVWATGVIYMAMRTGRHLWRIARKDEDEFYAHYLEGRKDERGYEPIETLQRASTGFFG